MRNCYGNQDHPAGERRQALDSYGQDGQSFAETYAPIVELLLRESRLHAVVHTVPGGPAMAQAVCRLIEEARKRQGDGAEAMPFDVTPIVDVTARLRREDGCPWDRAQTHRTLRRYLIEEVYEMLDAIDSHDVAGIREELGTSSIRSPSTPASPRKKAFFGSRCRKRRHR